MGDGLSPVSAATAWADTHARALYEADIQELVLARWYTYSLDFVTCFIFHWEQRHKKNCVPGSGEDQLPFHAISKTKLKP